MRVEISHRITPNEYISYFAYSVRSNIAGSIPRTVPTVPVAIHRIRFLPIRKESKSHKLDKRLNKPLKQSFNSNTMKRFFSRDFWMQKSTVQSWCYVSTGGNLLQSEAFSPAPSLAKYTRPRFYCACFQVVASFFRLPIGQSESIYSQTCLEQPSLP
eukprot:TRINITY_DN944_c0_g1_i2.p1 TRINITY_DN944_c0_g1~~TRINITY_DN944_c0_g1_i2.p1  ORF type:complete len:157 (-),score=4.96 TRINITY_DN944_c0_g1_i2:631-1101(-)